MIILFLHFLNIYFLKNIECYSNDLKRSETGYSRPIYEPEVNKQISYYGLNPNQYGSYEYPVEYVLHPKKYSKQYSSDYNNFPKNPSYLTSSEENEPKSYSSTSYPASSYGYGVPTGKHYMEQKIKYEHNEPPPHSPPESPPPSQYSKYKPSNSYNYRPYSTYYKKPYEYTANEPKRNVYSESPVHTAEYKPYASKYRYPPASHYPSSHEVYSNYYRPTYSPPTYSPYKRKLDYSTSPEEDHNYSSNSYSRPLY